jgi:hypothetical protein
MVILVSTAVVSVAVVVATGKSIRRLGYRAAPFWHVGTLRGEQLPAYLRSERPMGSPSTWPPSGHFMYLDRRPNREGLIPAHLAPREPIAVPGRVLVVWLTVGLALLAVGSAAWIGWSEGPEGIVAGTVGVVLILLAIKGRRQNRLISPGDG